MGKKNGMNGSWVMNNQPEREGQRVLGVSTHRAEYI